MIANKKKFTMGFVMLVLFGVVLAVMFSPVFNGQNGLSFLDDTFNSISKGSANYIPHAAKEASAFNGHQISFSFEANNSSDAKNKALLLKQGGADVRINGNDLEVNGDLGRILDACIKDAELMYENNGDIVKNRYNYDEKKVLYNWYILLQKIDSELTRQKNFKEAKVSALVNHKVVETAYNYYGIIAKSVQESAVILACSLVFYVVYTLWYGFGLMFFFEGIGLKFDH